jgi:transposase-like protein
MKTNNAAGSDLTLMTVMTRFSTEEAARKYFEGVRWPNGKNCPHCGNADESRIYALTANRSSKVRAGMYKCAECRDTFTVTVGTVMEDSHVPLNKWLIAFYMMCASKTQISALQLKRQLELGSYHTALFLCHRIRFALADIFPTQKLSGIVEADETYLGGKMRGKGRGYVGNKTPVVSLIERGGRVRSRVVG